METRWIRHPNLPGQEIEVPVQSVSMYSHSGWELMDGPPDRVTTIPEVAALAILEAQTDQREADVSASDAEGTSDSGDSDSGEKEEPTGAKRTRRATKKEDDQ